jgi:DNA primase
MTTGNCGAVQGSPKNHRSGGRRAPPCSPAVSVKSRSYSIRDIKDRLSPSHIEALCRDWLPGGKRQGGWYLACAPWRDDRNPSLGVSFSTGRWQDFATGEKGDMIDLSMRLFGDSLQDTLKGFAEMLGLSHA